MLKQALATGKKLTKRGDCNPGQPMCAHILTVGAQTRQHAGADGIRRCTSQRAKDWKKIEETVRDVQRDTGTRRWSLSIPRQKRPRGERPIHEGRSQSTGSP